MNESAIAEGTESAQSNVSVENITQGELASHFMRKRMGPPEEEPAVEQPEGEVPEVVENEEVETEEPEPETAEETEETEEDSVLSQLNLDELTQEQLKALGDEIKSNVPQRIGKEVAKRKAAEEEAQRLRQQLTEARETENLLEPSKPVTDNPFKDIDTIHGLQEQAENFRQIEEWADDLLDEHDNASYDEVITEQDGKELTKRDVRDYLKKARKARETYLPARLQDIQRIQQDAQVKEALAGKVREEIPWVGDTDSDINKEYEMVLNDPTVALIRERVPEAASRLDYMLAHFVNSLSSQMQAAKQKAPVKSAPIKPPSAPAETASRGNQHEGQRIKKQLGELNARFQDSKSTADFIALRTAQRMNKK